MRKKVFGYTLFGSSMGLTLSVMMTLIASLLRGDGQWHFTSANLIIRFGSEVNAVAAECAGAMLLGAIWANATMIFSDTDWSLLKQSAIHCLVCTVPSMAIAVWLKWFPLNWDGVMQCVRLFGVIYMLNWVLQYMSFRKRIKQLNAKLKELPQE